jgi:hypothetical protein
MAEPKDIILSKLNPKIPLKELWATDDSELSIQNPDYKPTQFASNAKDSIGTVSPYVTINDSILRDIDQLIIDETGMIPKIKIIFNDITGEMSGPAYPKNNPIVSVYFKTKNPNFKPVRVDFLITSMRSNQDVNSHVLNAGAGATFILLGEMYIPKLYNNASRCYSNMTSKEALLRIADDLDLGYANNTFTTNDKMTWINPNKNYAWFINHIAKHAYRDDDTFFKVFIDKYYHLNFISIPEQLDPNSELAYTFKNSIESDSLAPTNYIDNIQKGLRTDDDTLDLIRLTNLTGTEGQSHHIIKYNIMGDLGGILKNKGYKRQIYYYDHTIENDKFISFYMNPIKIKGYEKNNKQSHLIPDDDELKNATVKKWMNIDYGNTHREWNSSILINDLNNSELDKVKLKVEVEGINFQVVRGMGIPVNIYNKLSDAELKNNKRTDDESQRDPSEVKNIDKTIKDDVLSGRYLVSGARYIYDKFDDFLIKTEYQLVKMNWLGEKNIF